MSWFITGIIVVLVIGLAYYFLTQKTKKKYSPPKPGERPGRDMDRGRQEK